MGSTIAIHRNEKQGIASSHGAHQERAVVCNRLIGFTDHMGKALSVFSPPGT